MPKALVLKIFVEPELLSSSTHMQLALRRPMALLESGVVSAWRNGDELDVERELLTASDDQGPNMNLSQPEKPWEAFNRNGFQMTPSELRSSGKKRAASLVLVRNGQLRSPSAAAEQDTEQETQDDYSSSLCTDDSNSDDSCDAASQSSSFDLATRTSPGPRPSHNQPKGPDPLTFLENDSPPVTEKSILQAIAQASENWSPRSISSFGSIDSSQQSGRETPTTTPDHSVGGDSPPATAVPRPSHLGRDRTSVTGSSKGRRGLRARRPQLHPHLDAVQDRYGTPEMARGSAKHPHFRPDELQPRLIAPGQGYPKYLPRAEKLPMTGYELLAAKLSTSDPWPRRRGSTDSSQSDEGPAIKPIYRKFEALNHRLLLHLQDELTELEEQLHRLDTADTQTRRLQNCILPASRRSEAMAGGELQWRKTDTLGKIGFKLTQYSKYCAQVPR